MAVPDIDTFTVFVDNTGLMELLAPHLGPHLKDLCLRAPISGSFKSRIGKHFSGLRMLAFEPLFCDHQNTPRVILPAMIDKRGPGLEQLSLEGVGPKVQALQEHSSPHAEELLHWKYKSNHRCAAKRAD